MQHDYSLFESFHRTRFCWHKYDFHQLLNLAVLEIAPGICYFPAENYFPAAVNTFPVIMNDYLNFIDTFIWLLIFDGLKDFIIEFNRQIVYDHLLFNFTQEASGNTP